MNKIKIVVLILLAVLINSCNYLYYKISYKPEAIKQKNYNNIPDSSFVNNTPCISYKTAYCSSASYQMIGYQKGLTKDIGFYNWVMGFTYGALYITKTKAFIPYNDPETGYVAAQSYTALKRHYLISNDSLRFIKAVKYYISKNEPLRVGLNPAILLHIKGFSPHSELIVGYDRDSVYYYETGISDRKLNGFRGESCTWHDFLLSVSSFCKGMGYTWKYNISTFEPIVVDTLDLIKCSKRNGELLIGDKIGPYIRTGSFALKDWGSFIREYEKGLNWDYISIWTEEAGIIRKDNAEYLHECFKNIPKIDSVCNLLYKSSDNFAKMTEMIKNKDCNKMTIGEYLIQCSKYENEAGKILVEISKENK